MTLIFQRKRLNSFSSIILLGISVLSLGASAQNFHSYCFARSVDLNQATSFVKSILTSQDKVNKNSALNCLEIQLDDARVELVRKYLSTRYQTHTNFEAAPSLCDMEITEVMNSNKNSQTISVGRQNNISQSVDNNSAQSVSILKTLEGKWSSLEMNDSTVEIRCYKRGLSFEIEVRIGSENSFLSTSRIIQSNEKVELGEMVQSLNDKNKTISLQDGVTQSKSKGNKQKKYYLVIR